MSSNVDIDGKALYSIGTVINAEKKQSLNLKNQMKY